MSTRNDVASFLVEKHDTSLDAGDITPRFMALNYPAGASVNEIIKKHAIRKNRKEQKEKGETCFGCKKKFPPSKLSVCQKCHFALYCTRACQTDDWISHKPKCKVLRKGFKIGLDDVVDFGTQGFLTAPSSAVQVHVKHREGFVRPEKVAVDEWFWIKAQSAGIMGPVLIYDETRSCFFQAKPGGEAHAKLVEECTKQTAVMGRKVHVEARFDANGNCYVYPHTACLKKW
jgi:hypothetical protein